LALRLLLPVLCLAAPAAAQDERGPGFTLYQRHCRTCHVLVEGDHRLGPSLAGVVGREAGAADGFGYSRTMAQSSVVWDAASLDAFLADPSGFMPGNAMIYPGMPSVQNRAAVIDYLSGGEG
jgi:cytochrome c